jgi:hypothetical protein
MSRRAGRVRCVTVRLTGEGAGGGEGSKKDVIVPTRGGNRLRVGGIFHADACQGAAQAHFAAGAGEHHQ